MKSSSTIRTTHQRIIRRAATPLMLLLLPASLFAGEAATGRHSLILRPPIQNSWATAEPSADRSASESTQDATPSFSLHHRLTKRPAILPAPNGPDTSNSGPTAGANDGSLRSNGSNANEQMSSVQTQPPTSAPSQPSPLGSEATSSARTAAAGSAGTPTQLPGSVQRLLQAYPALSNLLQPLLSAVIAPSPEPPATPSSAPGSAPSTGPTTGNAILTWNANAESDLAGYKIYVGTASGTYNLAGMPIAIGKTTSYTVTNLPLINTYFFAVSAYDTAGNESPLSSEVSKSIF